MEDVIFDRDEKATERLIEKASRMLEEKNEVKVVETESAQTSLEERLVNALVKGKADNLENDLKEAMEEYGSALGIIEGPLMEGMEIVGKLFGDGKMFLPQVVKSAKIMREAVEILEPFMESGSKEIDKPKVVIATVKGDVHDIGKNITGIVLTCNGFEVHDLGVMVDRDTILDEAERLNADIVAVSGLITPSLYQMEEICRAMKERGMTVPLLIGGATTSAVHTAVKLAPLYDHVFYGADASAAAVHAKKCILDIDAFEAEQHKEQERLREMYMKEDKEISFVRHETQRRPEKKLLEDITMALPQDILLRTLTLDEVMPYFDWKMFYAIWGVKYSSHVPEVMELIQLRKDAEAELEMRNFKIKVSARFMKASSDGKDIIFTAEGQDKRLPMMRQENGRELSLCDFVASDPDGNSSSFGLFAVCVEQGKHHEEGCSCPACANRYEDLVGKTIRMTLAEAASKWLDTEILRSTSDEEKDVKVIKPAAGYASCPDHTLKGDILQLLSPELGIKLTESYAMTPESSICGLVFMHPEASYPDIRCISQEQYEDYGSRRGMDAETARRFLGHLLK